MSSVDINSVNIKNRFFLYLACAGTFIVTIINSNFDNRASLRVSREILCVFLLLLSMQGTHLVKRKFNYRIFKALLMCITLALFLLTIVQFFAIRQGRNISLPENWYPRNLILATQLDFTYSNIRPSATFTEPSYLGLVAFAMMCIGYYLVKNRKSGSSILYLNFLTICISQSKAGIFFGLLLLFYRIKDPLVNLKKKTSYSLGRKVPVFITLSLVLSLYFNFMGLSESNSIADRITRPAAIIFRYIYNFPFGVPYYERLNSNILEEYSESWVALSHNGFFNLIFDYGFLGFVLAAVLFSNSRKELPQLLFLIFLGIQNGGFLDFDKVALYFVFKASLNSIDRFRFQDFDANPKPSNVQKLSFKRKSS